MYFLALLVANEEDIGINPEVKDLSVDRDAGLL